MNIIKTTGIGAMLLMLCTVCTEFPKDPGVRPGIPDGYNRFLSVVAEVSQAGIPVKIADNYEIELFGNATSCNLSSSGAPCITINGVITQTDKGGNFNFESAELLLESTVTDCKLWGQFNGRGSIEGDRFTINSDVEVACGTGLFESNGGTLKMAITGSLPTEDNPSPIYELTLNGQLEK
jgi:hypothetical protein